MSAPTLINLPPPPSDPVTPSDMGPGTPNSATTSMSELSTVAIKDGHRGHLPHHSHSSMQPGLRSSDSSTNTLEAERADRISRLPGLGRVGTARQAANAVAPADMPSSQPPGYFDPPIQPGMERSTVGSASATGSVGGRTTWASGSDMYEPDKMSEDMDTSSTGGFSDEGNASLVGFGEAASSTVSGPVSTAPGSRTPQRQGVVGSAYQAKGPGIPQHLRDANTWSTLSVASSQTTTSTAEQKKKAKMIDGMTYDSTMVDTADTTPPPVHPNGRAMDIDQDEAMRGQADFDDDH